MRQSRLHYIELTPKNDAAKLKLSYHGNRWVLKKEIDVLGQSKLKGPFIGVESRDGKKFMWIKKVNDPEFNYREMQSTTNG